tara:strand:+ start:14678 stop:14809 length:132 start_codon:yes stop_codon:yes gene_type:complete
LKTNSNFIYLNGLYWENKTEEVEELIENNFLFLKEVKAKKLGK